MNQNRRRHYMIIAKNIEPEKPAATKKSLSDD
jgi:hypothetical protein